MGYLLEDKKDETITKAFQKILDESNCKPSNIWVDKGSEFYNRSLKSRFKSKITSCRKIY